MNRSTIKTGQSAYTKIFEKIISPEAYENGSYDTTFLEYLWGSLNGRVVYSTREILSYPCNVTNVNLSPLAFINLTMQEFINASRESVKSGNTVKALLLGDMMDGLPISLTETALAPYGGGNANANVRAMFSEICYYAACIVYHKLKELSFYEKLALERYGEPPFNLTAIEELNNRIRPYLSYTPMNGTQMINWEPALTNLVYVLSYRNTSLLNKFSAGYTPDKAAQLLENFTKTINSNVYLKSIFKPAIVYLTILRYQDILALELGHPNLVNANIANKTSVSIDEFYLRVFYAWYNIVKPYTLWGE